MGVGGGGSQTIGYRYFMSIQMGLCRGPIDEIVQIDVGDVRAWPVPDGEKTPSLIDIISGTPVPVSTGLQTIAEGPGGNGVALYESGSSSVVAASEILTIRNTTVTTIDAPNLFGGDKKEGGISGTLNAYFGAKAQIYATKIKQMLGGLVPDFRGVVTIFFDGLVTSLNPYPKAWKFRVRRVLSGWDGEVWQPSLAVIWLRNGTIKAMNPMHIIYECLTNRDWGRGFPRAVINDAQATLVAQKLKDEQFGLCLRWNRQDELGDFIQEIIDHIGGSMYLDRTTGLINVSLLRGNYDAASLPTFTYDTGLISIEDDQTNAGDDLVNEVIINWKDPIKNEERQVRLHNLASLQSTGAFKSTTTSYSGAPVVELASRLGQRDLKAGATALKRFKVTLDRRAWRIIPGSVFKISAPDMNIFSVILRAGKVSEASAPDGRITVDAVIDVFGLPDASFVSGQDSQWQPPDRTAVVIGSRVVREATYGELVQRMSAADLALVEPTSGMIATVAAKPSPLSQSFGINTRTGAEDFVRRNAGTFVPIASAAAPIGVYDTVISFNAGSDLGLVEVGSLVQIENEICRLDDITTADGLVGTITIARGCADTLPSAHASGTKIFFGGEAFTSDGREYVAGETVDVRLTTVTSTQELDVAVAANDALPITGRQGRPWPPANLKIGGTPFGSVGPVANDIVFAWSHRDRTIIQDQLLEHSAASVGPEAGTTYRVRVYKTVGDTVPVRTVTDINDTTWTYTNAMRVSDGVGSGAVFELDSVRDGIASQFRYRVALNYASTPTPSALSSFIASGTTTITLSATTPSNANTSAIQFYRSVHGVALNSTTDKLGSTVPAGSSSTATKTDTPGTGNWDYYAQPVSSSGVLGPLSGPINRVIA